jgi:hypothetical protein
MRAIRERQGAHAGSLLADDRGITLRVGDAAVWTIPWSGIERVSATRAAGFVGDTLVVVVEADGAAQTITDDVPGFHDAAIALSQRLPGSADYRAWTAQLLAQPPGQMITVYETGR